MAFQELVRAVLGDGMGGVRGGLMLETAVGVPYSYLGDGSYKHVPRVVKASKVGEPFQVLSTTPDDNYELAAERVHQQPGVNPDAFIADKSTTAQGEPFATVQFYKITGFQGYDVADLFGFSIKRGLTETEAFKLLHK